MVSIAHIKDLKRLSNFKKHRWAYIACQNDIDELSKYFSDENKFSTAEKIVKITDDIRQNFVNFIGQLSNQQKNRVLWYSSRMASKSMSQTDIFHQYVYIKLIENISKEEGDVLFITDNDDLLHSLYELNFENVKIVSNIIDNRLSFTNWLRGCFKVIRYFSLWVFLKPFKDKSNMDDVCFLHMWIDRRLFNNSTLQNDPYWGDLESKLETKDHDVIRLAPLSIKAKDVIKTKRHVPNVIFPLSYIGLFQFLKCLKARFEIQMDVSVMYEINDLNVLEYLAKKEVIKERISKYYLDYLLYYHAYKGIGAYIFDTATIIYLYENQPWEKMLNMAFNGCNRIGYQHSTIPYNWLDYYCSEVELSEPKPTVVLTSGKCWADFLKESNKHINVEEAGTIRYKYLFEEERLPRKKGSNNIIVALPIDIVSALHLQSHIIKVLKKDVLRNYKIIIKPHPYLSRRYIKLAQLTRFANVTVTNDPINELLGNCELLISLNSTVAFESLFAGIKTIQFVPEELTQGIEHFIRDSSYCAYEYNFEDIILKALESSDYPKLDMRDYFSPINYDKFFQYTNASVN